ncbi:hypothetical protein [Roseicyclus marinus]|uniref:Uncharacterized protein n=1 Tax=Roseicyclus marinus TaxID=2161673 RepID=A0AA48HEV4_9RHOB|nr:hypothetical protein MACH21_05010 [Roseicyclus marinus]
MEIFVGDLRVTEDIWVPIAATLLGGMLALLGSFGAMWWSNRFALRTREAELERLQAERAFGTLFKLLHAHNAAANLDQQISEMFLDAAQNGAEGMDPWAKVMELVGAPDEIQSIDPSETAFLIHMKKSDLLNDIHLIQMRIANIMGSVEKYSSLRAEMQTFLSANMVEGNIEGGTQMQAAFHGGAAVQAELMTARLNNLLGQIIEKLDEDIPISWDILCKFKDAAILRYGKLFPEFELRNDATGKKD